MAHMLGIKVGTLLVKTITKPLANSLKRQAADNGWFRSICYKYGQLHHQLESRLSARLSGHKLKTVKPQSEDIAVQLGATVFSELFLFLTATGLVIFEMQRKSRLDDEAAIQKSKSAEQQKIELENRFKSLEAQIENIKLQLNPNPSHTNNNNQSQLIPNQQQQQQHPQSQSEFQSVDNNNNINNISTTTTTTSKNRFW